MPRKSSPRAAATPKTPVASDETPTRRGSRKASATKQPAKEAETSASDPKRSRRSSTAAQTAASQADSRKTRSRTSTSTSPDRKSSVDESTDRGSPSPRTTRRPMKKVNYEESEGEEEDSSVKPEQPEEDYDAEEDFENDSDSLESTSKKKGKLKAASSPPKGKGVKTKGRSVRSTRAGRPSRKKKDSEEDEPEEEEEEEVESTETTDGPAAPTRRGRHSTDKDDTQKEEKPKGATRSRRTTTSTPTAPVATPSSRPSRAAKQKKSPVANVEAAKPVRTSSRRGRSKVEESQEDEEMEKDDDEAAEKPEEVEHKKRKLEATDEEKQKSSKKIKKTEDAEETEESAVGGQEEVSKEDKEAEASEEPEKPMEVDEASDKTDSGNKESKSEQPTPIEEEPVEKDDVNEKITSKKKAEVGKSAPVESKDDDDDEEEEEEEEEEEDEDQEEEALKQKDMPAKPTQKVESTDADHSASSNQNDVVQPPENKYEEKTSSSVAPPVQEPLSNSAPTNAATEPPKTDKSEAFQNALAKSSHESVNGTPAADEPDKVFRNETPATQMLPSSAVELNQQHSTTPTKTEGDVLCVSANGHVSDEKANVETNDHAAGLFHGRSYKINPSPCAVALSNIRERTFGLVSLNLEAAKMDEKLWGDLKALNCDIICMQGLHTEQFTKHLEPSLDALGYKGTFAQDEGRGVATFYRTSSFAMKTHRSLLLKQSIGKEMESSLHLGEVVAVGEKLPPCGQVLFTHLGLLQSSRTVAVANVLVPPSDVSTQALQMSCLAREAVVFLESSSTGSGVPLVLCGGFNIQQKEAAYQLLRDGYLSNEMIEALQNKKELKLPGREEHTSLLNLMWKSFQHSTSGLKSCYSAVTGQEIEFGNPGCSTSPDLIWFSSDSLTPIGVLQAPPPATPTLGHHLPLKADLAFNY